MPAPLLFQQIVPVDEAQAALTRMCLTDISESLMTYFLALRAETDAVLAPLLPPAGGKPYPYGRCEEITRELHARLVKRLERPTCAWNAPSVNSSKKAERSAAFGEFCGSSISRTPSNWAACMWTCPTTRSS